MSNYCILLKFIDEKSNKLPLSIFIFVHSRHSRKLRLLRYKCDSTPGFVWISKVMTIDLKLYITLNIIFLLKLKQVASRKFERH